MLKLSASLLFMLVLTRPLLCFKGQTQRKSNLESKHMPSSASIKKTLNCFEVLTCESSEKISCRKCKYLLIWKDSSKLIKANSRPLEICLDSVSNFKGDLCSPSNHLKNRIFGVRTMKADSLQSDQNKRRSSRDSTPEFVFRTYARSRSRSRSSSRRRTSRSSSSGSGGGSGGGGGGEVADLIFWGVMVLVLLIALIVWCVIHIKKKKSSSTKYLRKEGPPVKKDQNISLNESEHPIELSHLSNTPTLPSNPSYPPIPMSQQNLSAIPTSNLPQPPSSHPLPEGFLAAAPHPAQLPQLPSSPGVEDKESLGMGRSHPAELPPGFRESDGQGGIY